MSTGGGGTPGDAPAGMVWGGNGWVPAPTDPVSDAVNNGSTSGGVLAVSDGTGASTSLSPQSGEGWAETRTGSNGENKHWQYYSKPVRHGYDYIWNADYREPLYSDATKSNLVGFETGRWEEKSDPGWFGRQFQKAGYKYLGPGTDLSYNQRNNVQPVDDLDYIAKEHDYAYNNIEKNYVWGFISYDEAASRVAEADEKFIESARLLGDWSGQLSALGMTAKELWDNVNGPSFAGIYASGYASKRSDVEGKRVGDYVYVWNGEKMTVEYDPIRAPDPQIIEPSGGYHAGDEGLSGRHASNPPVSQYPSSGNPVNDAVSNGTTFGGVLAAYDDDRDRNYFPDRRQPLFRRRKRRRYH